jgi:thiol:disulfide interchange protein DsbD
MIGAFAHFLEWLNGLNYALGEAVRGQLASGSPLVVVFVFLAGVVTSFTPCVYPVIPVTVTYIGGAASGSRRRAVSLSAVYVVGLSVVYASLGMLSAILGRTFGTQSQSPWVNVIVGLLIIVFGLAMFGLYDIRVPAFFGAVQTRGVRKGGHLGAFVIGVASGFIAAPCTAPVLGVLLLIISQRGSVLLGGFLVLVFSLGLGFLLLVLGIFSGMLSNLPRPGAWMTWVKKGFGVAMLVLGLFFLWQGARAFLT